MSKENVNRKPKVNNGVSAEHLLQQHEIRIKDF